MGSMIELMATSKTAYMKGGLPGVLLPAPASLGDPLLTIASTGDPAILASGLVSCGVTAPFLWVLVPTDLVCALQDWSLFHPVLWNAYNQIPLAFKVRFPRGFQSLCQIPRLGSLTWGSEPSQQWENFFGISFSSLWVNHIADMGFDLVVIVPLLPSHCSIFFVFGSRVSFFDGFQRPPVDGCSTDSCDFGALTGGDECISSTPPFWTRSPLITILKEVKINTYVHTYIKEVPLIRAGGEKKKKGKGNRCGKMIQTMKLSVFEKTYRMRKVFS